MSTTTELIFTGGDWSTVPYKYVTQDVAVDYVIYVRATMAGAHGHSRNNISYTQSTGLWSQLPGNNDPYHLNTVDSYETSSGQSVSDSQTIYGYDSLGTLIFVFDSPWYEPATVTEGDGIPQLDVLDVSPAILTRLTGEAGGIWSDESSYRYCGSSSNFHVYDLWSSYDQNWSSNNPRSLRHSIKVDYDPTSPTFNTWSDNGDDNPTSVTDDGTNVFLSTVFAFVKPVITLTLPPPPPPPPPSPIFVPRSARRGNLNFW